MTIEKQLEVLRKALESGGNIFVKYHGLESEEEAAAIMTDFTGDFEHHSYERTNWFSTDVEGIGITTFYKNSNDDRIRDLEKQIASLRSESA